MVRRTEIDSGYAWIILAAVFVSALLTFGGTKAFGVFYVEFLERYGEGSGSTAWIASFSMGLMLACGIFSTWLTQLFSVRKVMFAGGVIAAAGHVSSAYVTRMELLYVTYGLLTGVGRGMCFAPSLMMVNTYFVRRRAFANGVAFAGSGVGSFVLPFLTRVLINNYGLSGALLILTGVTLNLCVCAAFMRPLSSCKNSSDPEQPPKQELDSLTDIKNAVAQTDTEDMSDPCKHNNSIPCEAYTNLKTPLQSKSKQEAEQEKTRSTYSIEVEYNPTYNVSASTEPGICCKRRSCSIGGYDFSILTYPVFLIFETAFILTTVGYLTHFIMLPAHAVNIGFSKPQSDLLLSVIGIADIVGRISIGWFSDLKVVSRRNLSVVLTSVGGVCAILIPLSSSYAVVCSYAAAVGLIPGSGSVIIFVLITERIKHRMNPSVFGIHSTLFAIPALFGPPIVGWLKDCTGSWEWSFRLVGSCMLMATVICLFIGPAVTRRARRKENLEMS